MQSADYNKIWHSCFEKTECIITADGSNDTKTNPEGLINHIVPKHLPAQVSEDAINCLVPESAPEPEDIIMGDNDQFQDQDVQNDDVPIDDENDHEYDHIIVIVKYVLFMTMGGTKGPFNGIIQKYIYIRCCSMMELMTI